MKVTLAETWKQYGRSIADNLRSLADEIDALVDEDDETHLTRTSKIAIAAGHGYGRLRLGTLIRLAEKMEGQRNK